MSKLTVRKVLNAYKKTGLIPIQHKYLRKKKGKWCGCVATALYCAKHKVDLDYIAKSPIRKAQLISQIIRYLDDLTDNKSTLVIYGFDGGYLDRPESDVGYQSAVKLGLINENN